MSADWSASFPTPPAPPPSALEFVKSLEKMLSMDDTFMNGNICAERLLLRVYLVIPEFMTVPAWS